MVKLSQIASAVKCYLEIHGDKEVTNIVTSNVDYTFNLHDIYEGPIGSNPYSGKDSIVFLKGGANSHCTDHRPQSDWENMPVVEASDNGNQLYAAVIKTDAVRDVQVCRDAQHDDSLSNWVDVYDAEIWLGLFWGPDARNKAAAYGNTDPANIRLIVVPKIGQ